MSGGAGFWLGFGVLYVVLGGSFSRCLACVSGFGVDGCDLFAAIDVYFGVNVCVVAYV